MNPVIWRGMTRAELDAAYNNSAAVNNSAEKIAEWTSRSAETRARPGALLDVVYGPRSNNRIDIFPCGGAHAPMFVFIHGGYWQRNSKEIFACMAEGPLARGFDAALIGYTLAPQATLTEIVREIRGAVKWLRAEGARFGVGEGKILLSGWSAGGHLTAMALDEADAGLAISGIYDLEPCRLNYLNEKLNLTLEEQNALSPLRQLSSSSRPLTLAWGTRENCLNCSGNPTRMTQRGRLRIYLPNDCPSPGTIIFQSLKSLRIRMEGLSRRASCYVVNSVRSTFSVS